MRCHHCGLHARHSTHGDLKECLVLAKSALEKLAMYRLLDGDDNDISPELRMETLDIAMNIHKKEVHEAIKTKEGEVREIKENQYKAIARGGDIENGK